MTSQAVRSAPPLPGGVGISRLRVYDWEGPDGLRGGSPHVHLVCSEAISCSTARAPCRRSARPGSTRRRSSEARCWWFTPGLIHRLINHGDLEIIVLMQIATLPEAGDCFLSFPEDVLRDRQAYLAAGDTIPAARSVPWTTTLRGVAVTSPSWVSTNCASGCK